MLHVSMARKLLILNLCFIFYAAASATTQRCEETDTEMSCSEKKLNNVPKVNIQNKIESLDMSQNDLEQLFKVDFNEYVNLVTLYLSDNSISYIEDDTFESLSQLEFLDLSRNLLEEIPENIIASNKKLTVLDLSENLFQSQTPALVSKSLEVLDLSQCKLSRFSNESIQNLPNLRLLYLNSNNLVTLDHRMFAIPKLFYYVQIDFNPWECSCDTVKMLKHLTDNNMFAITQPVSCVDGKKSHIHIYDKDGPKMCKTKRKVMEEFTTLSNSIELDFANDINPKSIYLSDDEMDLSNDEKMTKGIQHLEEILKNEKIYFQELKNEKDVLDSVTVWTVKIFILVIFFSGIALGVLISAIVHRRVRRVRSNLLLKTGSMTI
ncbi:hypothetical protein Trydic_g20770 [Trypoxylus dichotomus]